MPRPFRPRNDNFQSRLWQCVSRDCRILKMQRDAAVLIALRILALIIDCGVCVFSILGLLYVREWASDSSGQVGIAYILLWLAFFALWPFVYFGVTTGLWGATLGKFLCRLKIDRTDGGFGRGFRRETFKLLTIFSIFGAFFCAFEIFHRGTTWYDGICGTRVELRSGKRLTKTQKRFREYMHALQKSRD